MVDYRAAFAAVRRDPHWKRKVGLGALIQLIPYVGTVWMLGWTMEYQRNVAWDSGERVPDFSDFAGQAMQGLRAFVVVLPYSVVLGLLITPAFMAAPLLGVLMGSDASLLATVAIAAGAVLSLAMTVLIIPLSSSTILRVALYETLESGFQYKEIWRLMRERRSELIRAWGFATINLCIHFGVAVLCFGTLILLTVLITILFSSLSELASVLAFLVVGAVGYLGCIVLISASGLYLGLAHAHYFGMYGRAAYQLDTTGIQTAATEAWAPADS